MGNLGDLYTNLGEYAKAESLLLPAVQAARRTFPTAHPIAGFTMRKYGDWLTAQRRFDSAESTLLESHQILSETLGPDHDQTMNAASSLVQLYEAWNRDDLAEAWRVLQQP